MTRWEYAERVTQAICAVSLPPRTRIRVCVTLGAPHAADAIDTTAEHVRASLSAPAYPVRVSVHDTIRMGADPEELTQWALDLAARLDMRRVEALDESEGS